MKKIKLLVFAIFTSFIGFSQNDEDVIVVPAQESIPADREEPDYDMPFAVLEVIPNFEVCKDLENQEAKSCFMENMNKHIKDNFVYPKEALDANMQGRVIVLFVINKMGEVESIKTKGTINGSILEQEAKRIIEALPRFSPGKQRGKTINTSYAQPITFKITPPESKKEGKK